MRYSAITLLTTSLLTFGCSSDGIETNGITDSDNLTEIVDSKDPVVDQGNQLEILNYSVGTFRNYFLSQEQNYVLAQQLEEQLGEKRPFIENINEDSNADRTIAIEIDINGNGTYLDSTWRPSFEERLTGTRTNTGSSLTWEGRYSLNDRDVGHSGTFRDEVILVNESTRELVQEVSEKRIGTFKDTLETSNRIIGEVVEGTSRCKPIYGMLSTTRGTDSLGGGFGTIKSTITKQIGDQYWKVLVVTTRGEYNFEYVLETREYLVEELFEAVSDSNESLFSTFKCVFVDF